MSSLGLVSTAVTKTSVVIVCHRPGDWLGESVGSVVGQADEVIVVDNGSDDGEAAVLADRLGARTVTAGTNLGFAAGVNLGIRHSRGDVIGLLNDDAKAGEGWLRSAAALLRDPSVAAVTPKVLLSQEYGEFAKATMPQEVRVGTKDVTDRVFVERGRVYVPLPDEDDPAVRIDGDTASLLRRVELVNHAGMYLHRHGYVGDYGLGAPDDGRFDQLSERFGCSGAAPVFRAETLRRVGPFAEEFFAYNEDFDWCFRARLAGMRFLYDPAVKVHHRMSATSGSDRIRAVRLLTRRNQLLTLVRNAPSGVAAEHLGRAALSPHLYGVRVQVARRLPWAVATRRRLARNWVRRPEEIWREWVGVDDSDWRPRD